MKKYNYIPCLLALACVLLTSCLKSDDEDITLYDDAAITGFTLGTLTQKDPTTGTETTLTGSVYKMGIDQINNLISNRDSLPVGTVVNSVHATITSLNGSGVAIRSLNDTTLFTWYYIDEAIDFSSPRIFRVFSTDGSYARDYRVTVNVKKTQTEGFWTEKADTTLLGGFDHMRILSIDTTLVIFGAQDNATIICTSSDSGKTWKKQDKEFDADAWKNAVVRGDSLYVLSDQQLFFSSDLKQWSSIANDWNLAQLVGAGTKELFALTADRMLKASMADRLHEWTDEETDNSISADSTKNLLGLEGISSVSFPYTAIGKTDYVLMVGNNGTQSVVWRKISQYEKEGNTGKWVNIPAESINHYTLPMQSRLSLVYIDGKVLAIGQDTSVYQSTDQGITWRVNDTYALPTEMQAVTIDANGVMWGVSTDSESGKIWRGYIYN